MRGDEAELFERYYERLKGATTRMVRTTPENVEDACAYAFVALMRSQPRRETLFAWLKVVARNEAVRLDQRERTRTLPLDEDFGEILPDRRDPIAAKEILLETQALLSPLREREKTAVLLRGMGWSYEEAAERLGVSATRLGQLLGSAGDRIRQQQREADLERPDAPPRARLLDQLQHDPPPFLRAAIGRPPPASHKTGGFEKRLEWSRLALRIIDYRIQHGVTDAARALGERPPEPERSDLVRRIEHFNEIHRPPRSRDRGIDR